jgi:hypothetical protein
MPEGCKPDDIGDEAASPLMSSDLESLSLRSCVTYWQSVAGELIAIFERPQLDFRSEKRS